MNAAGVFAMLLAAASAAAQDDPLAYAPDENASPGPSLLADLLLRIDHVGDLPAGREDLERVRGRLRLGLSWWLDGRIELGAAAKLALGSDDNRDNRRNNDNERSDAVTLDRLYARWQAGDDVAVQLGKSALPLALSPLVWDEDLRPAGIAVDYQRGIGDFDRLRVVVGGFAGQHLYGDDSRIAAAQLSWQWRQGAPNGGGVALAYLRFDDLDRLTRQGLARTNRQRAGRLVSDYRLLDLLLTGRIEAFDRPLRGELDLVRNLGADDRRDAARLELSYGDSGIARGWEIGWVAQRIQRDAVMAAFNADDWWFHSAARGHGAWLAYGVDERWRIRLTAFAETRDDLSQSTHRLLLDLIGRW